MLIAEPANSTIVVGLSNEPALVRRLAIIDRINPFGAPPTPLQLLGALAGIATPTTPGASELRATLAQADVLEAEFHGDAARELRDAIVAAYESSPLVDSAVQMIAGLALHDRAASLIEAGQQRDALMELTNARRRFPAVALNTRKHPPNVLQAYERAGLELTRLRSGSLTVATTRPGTVMLDGRTLGTTRDALTREVPVGRYLAWVSDANGRSLAHPIEIGTTPLSVVIDFDLEARLAIQPAPWIHCPSDCVDLLQRLARVAGATRVIGVRMTGATTSEAVIVEGTSAPRTEPLHSIDELADPPLIVAAPGRDVSLWSYTPFGIAQFKQGRPVVGAAFAAVTAGAVAWNVVASVNRDQGSHDDSRKEQFISAGVIAGAIIASVIDGIVHDYRDGTYP